MVTANLGWIVWEQVDKCPLCGSDKVCKYFTKDMQALKLTAFECQSCCLIYHNPRMSKVSMAHFYQGGYYRQVFKYQEDLEVIRSRRLVDFIDDYGLNPRRCLDIGCGRGHFLRMMDEKYGTMVIGVDINPNEPVIPSVVRNKNVVEGTFDLVACIHTLEHVYDVKSELKWMWDRISPGGYLLLEVPGPHILSIAHPYGFNLETIMYMLGDKKIVAKDFDKKYRTLLVKNETLDNWKRSKPE